MDSVSPGLPAIGRRGYSTFVPPPQGCCGWDKDGKPIGRDDGSGSGEGMQDQFSPMSSKAGGSQQPSPNGMKSFRGSAMLGQKSSGAPSPQESPRPKPPGSTTLRQSQALSAQQAQKAQDSGAGAASFRKSQSWAKQAQQQQQPDTPTQPSISGLPEVATPEAAAAARLVSDALSDYEPAHLGPLKSMVHLGAAAKADQEALMREDEELAAALEQDAGVLEDGREGKDAFKAYCSSLAVFDPNPRLQRLAFQAVTRDDAKMLLGLLSSGQVQWQCKNKGGQTLLDVAFERQMNGAYAVLEDARKKEIEAKQEAKRPSMVSRQSSRQNSISGKASRNTRR